MAVGILAQVEDHGGAVMKLLEVGDRVDVGVPVVSLLSRVVPVETKRGTVRSVLHLGQSHAAEHGPVHYMVRLDEPLDGSQRSGDMHDMFGTGMHLHSDGRLIVLAPDRVRLASS